MKLLKRHHVTALAPVLILLLLYIIGCVRYSGFASPQVLINLFDDNSFLGIAAVGMTFVILSGGIDLTVGSMIGLTSILSALLIERYHLHPGLVFPAVIVAAGCFGLIMGFLIAVFEIAPFLVTLAGMFFLRGLALMVSLDSVPLSHPAVIAITSWRIPLGLISSPPLAVFMLLTVAAGALIASHTKFGRTVYATGSNAHSALLMGVKVKRTQIMVYGLSGIFGALSGVVYTLYTSSGNASAATGFELDVIAAVVIGGTLLTGGRGTMSGTLIGVLILGLVQTLVTFESTLSSWWAKIVTGFLLFAFVALQGFLRSDYFKRRF